MSPALAGARTSRLHSRRARAADVSSLLRASGPFAGEAEAARPLTPAHARAMPPDSTHTEAQQQHPSHRRTARTDRPAFEQAPGTLRPSDSASPTALGAPRAARNPRPLSAGTLGASQIPCVQRFLPVRLQAALSAPASAAAYLIALSFSFRKENLLLRS